MDVGAILGDALGPYMGRYKPLHKRQVASESVGLRLKKAHFLQGITVPELAELSGVSTDTIWALERGGRKAWPSTRKALSGALGIPEDWIWVAE